MKRIVLGVSVILMLTQNGFAKDYTDAEYDRKIAEQKTEVWKQIWRCNKAVNDRNKYTYDVNICLKSVTTHPKKPRKTLQGSYLKILQISSLFNLI